MSYKIKSEKSDDRMKCGEVYYENQKILFQCLFCDLSFEQSHNEFIEHLEDHLLTFPLNNVETKLEIKTEKPEFENNNEVFDENDNDSDDDKPLREQEDPIGSQLDDDEAEQLGLSGKIRKSKEDGSYHCPKRNCKLKFDQLTAIREHIKTTHPARGSMEYPDVHQSPVDKMYHCPFTDCKHFETTIDLIQKHMYDEHLQSLNKTEQFPCTKCDRIYYLKSSLREHLKKKHFVSFDDGMVIIKEIRTFKSDIDDKYHCPKCDTKFLQRAAIRTHIKTKHDEYFKELIESNKKIIKKPDGYDETPKPRVNPRELKISETDGLWHCPHCPEAKNTRRRLYLHIKTKHVDNTVCKICGKKLASSTSLDIHMKWHGERSFKCDYCEKTFYNRSNMMSHIRMHLGQKNYQCTHCDKRFTNGSDKKVHEKMVHEKKKDYQCETCGKEFYRYHDLKKHYLRHTGERAFQCHICQKSFYESHHLKDHFKLHTDLKPFECHICGTKYARKGALSHHIKAHAKVKQQFNCEICGQKFIKNSDLTSHMSTHQYLQHFG